MLADMSGSDEDSIVRLDGVDLTASARRRRISPTFFMSAAADPTNAPLSFSGQEYFRQRLVLSILSGRPVRIDKIRSADANPGLRGPHI